MSLRTIVRRLLVAVAAVTLAVPATRADAQPITYSFGGRLPRLLGGLTFSLDLQGDAGNVLDLGSLIGAPPGASLFATQATTGNVTVGGSGPVALDAIFGAGSMYLVGSVNGLAAFGAPFDNGVGFLGIGSNDLLVALFMTTPAAYDLTTSYGPVSGTAYAAVGAVSYGIDPSTAFRIRNPSFEATVTATPEPASIALMATGLVGLAGVAGRRRKQRA